MYKLGIAILKYAVLLLFNFYKTLWIDCSIRVCKYRAAVFSTIAFTNLLALRDFLNMVIIPRDDWSCKPDPIALLDWRL